MQFFLNPIFQLVFYSCYNKLLLEPQRSLKIFYFINSKKAVHSVFYIYIHDCSSCLYIDIQRSNECKYAEKQWTAELSCLLTMLTRQMPVKEQILCQYTRTVDYSIRQLKLSSLFRHFFSPFIFTQHEKNGLLHVLMWSIFVEAFITYVCCRNCLNIRVYI